MLGSPGKPVPDPEVGILSNTPALRPPDSSPLRPTSSARVQSPSLSIKSSRDSSIISSIPSSIPSSTAPSPSLSIPSLYGLPKSSVPTSYKTMSVLGTRYRFHVSVDAVVIISSVISGELTSHPKPIGYSSAYGSSGLALLSIPSA